MFNLSFRTIKGALAQQKAYFRDHQSELCLRSMHSVRTAALILAIVFLLFSPLSFALSGTWGAYPLSLAGAILLFFLCLLGEFFAKKYTRLGASMILPILLQVTLLLIVILRDTLAYPDEASLYFPLVLAAAPLLFYLPFRAEFYMNTAAFLLYVILSHTQKAPDLLIHDFFQSVVGYTISIAAAFIVLNLRIEQSISLSRLKEVQKAQKQLEQVQAKTEQAYQIAEQANHAKTRFLNNMSHDIRTPMNAIVGFSSLAITHIDQPDRVKDYLSKILSSSNHLLNLINDVLDMSRIESGKVEINESECSLPVIMHDIRNILQSDVKSKNLDFFIDTVDVIDENIICDKVRLSQIILNCMSNAVKYTKPGGTVGIHVVQKHSNQPGCADFDFIIRDNGIGMSPEFVKHIFEPFSREENSVVHQTQGTGLGMSIVKNIVDLMGGKINVKSKLGEGTEFTISLRFKTTTSSKKITVIKNLEGMRALVADDDTDSCLSINRMLKSIGLRPEWTTLGKEAVVRAQAATEEKDPFKVYIIDWLMPDMNGVEVVRRIRQRIGDEVPIIILTAYDWTDIEAEAREAGVTAFCDKPIFLSELYYVLQKASSPQQQEQEKIICYNDMFRGKRILLVDDVELNREIAQTILEEAGLDVITCSNGKEAVEFIRHSEEGYLDMVLMDIMMPVMDGYEATRRIRALENEKLARIPIIAMTANAFEEDRQAALDAGMNDHIAKPVQIDTLYEIMRSYLK